MIRNQRGQATSNQRGQATIGIVAVVAVISFILMMNLQSQAEILQRKIIAVKMQSEAEAAINDFAKQLYSAYVQAAKIKESMTGTLRYKDRPRYINHNTFDFFIEGTSGAKLCTNRTRNDQNLDICIDLPTDFAQIQKNYFIDPDFELKQKSFFVRLLFKAFQLDHAQAQRVQTAPFAPNPNVGLPEVAVNRSVLSSLDEAEFTEQYEQFNCEGTNPDLLGCVKIKICLKYGGCSSPDQQVKQTYVFLRVPQTQLRN